MRMGVPLWPPAAHPHHNPPNGVGKETAQGFCHLEVGGDKPTPLRITLWYRENCITNASWYHSNFVGFNKLYGNTQKKHLPWAGEAATSYFPMELPPQYHRS